MRTVTPTAKPRTSFQLTFVVIATGIIAYALLQSLVSPVLPTIQHHLHTDQSTVTWVLTAYLLSASVSTPLLGRLGDMFGKGRMFVFCLVALCAGSVLAAVAPSIGVLIIARAIQGLGGGAMPLAFGIVRDEFPGARVASAIGLLAALVAVGGGLGTVLAGPVVNALDYHWLFWIPAIITALAAVAAVLFIPDSPQRSPGRVSGLAVTSLSVWLVALLVAVSEAPTWGWGSISVIGLLVVAVVVGIAWVLIEYRSAHPLIDMQMMQLPAVWTANLVALLLGAGLYAMFAFLPAFLQTPPAAGYGFGSSITQSGLVLLPMTIFMFIFGMAAAPLAKRFGAKYVLFAGSVAALINFLILTFAHSHLWQIVVAGSIMGVGFGLAFSAMSGIVVASVRSEQTGVASGMNANIRTVGGGIGAAIMSSIVTSGARTDGLPKESGYAHGFAFLAVTAVLCSIAALLVPNSPRADEAPPLNHPELAMVAGGTLSGDGPE